MSKTKLQGMMINKIMVFWQTHMSWHLLWLIIRQQTFPKYLLSVHGFVRVSHQNSLKMFTKRLQKPACSYHHNMLKGLISQPNQHLLGL